jgi:hypothetical protein
MSNRETERQKSTNATEKIDFNTNVLLFYPVSKEQNKNG